MRIERFVEDWLEPGFSEASPRGMSKPCVDAAIPPLES
ncbi:hypothetical protein LG3211_3063 [Lysobacter gummosus]|nr:hypothetical protein LG3211_3063 [Lysobacter gummosus]